MIRKWKRKAVTVGARKNLFYEQKADVRNVKKISALILATLLYLFNVERSHILTCTKALSDWMLVTVWQRFFTYTALYLFGFALKLNIHNFLDFLTNTINQGDYEYEIYIFSLER